jgi:hypothetical protein
MAVQWLLLKKEKKWISVTTSSGGISGEWTEKAGNKF